MNFRHCLIASILTIASHTAIGAVINIPQSALLPIGDPGTGSWVASNAGLGGTTTMKLIAEVSGTAVANSFQLDIQDNGFPAPPAGGVTDNIVVFPPAATPGAMATVEVPPNCSLALFHDVYDATAEFLSGPDGILNQNPVHGTSDAYLSSKTEFNYTTEGRRQLVKYYIVNPSHSYQFTSQWDTVTQLGSGFRAFIFMDDDHTPNYDYDDMIVGIVAPPCVNHSECDDGDLCNGEETCAEGVCQAGQPIVCEDGLFCNGVEFCANGGCQAGTPRDCSAFGDQCNSGVCNEESDSCQAQPLLGETVCNDGDECTVGDACMAGVCHGLRLYGLTELGELADCLNGPDDGVAAECVCWDLNSDGHIDLVDTREFQNLTISP